MAPALIFISGGALQRVDFMGRLALADAAAYAAIVPLIFLSSKIRSAGAFDANVVVSALVSLSLGYLFPVFRLPKPRGPYQVGTFARHLIDRGRRERHASSTQTPRELMIQVWYPAKNVAGVRAWYRDPRINTAKSYHLRWVRTHSFWDLPAAEEPREFPVLLFSPSSGGFRSQNTFQVEELVSQTEVVGIDHPYSSRAWCSRRPNRLLAPWADTSNQAATRQNRKVELMLEDHVADASFVLMKWAGLEPAGSRNPRRADGFDPVGALATALVARLRLVCV
jgi:predicted dienelactone hydrolase